MKIYRPKKSQSTVPATSKRQCSRHLLFLAPSSGLRLALFGFDWLCFLRLRLPVYCHNLLSHKTLRYFVPAQIGFVFSNRTFSSLASAGWQPHPLGMGMAWAGSASPANWLCLALNWLYFFAAQNHEIPHNTLIYRYLCSFCPFVNWLCFFKFSSNFRRFSLISPCFSKKTAGFTLIFAFFLLFFTNIGFVFSNSILFRQDLHRFKLIFVACHSCEGRNPRLILQFTNQLTLFILLSCLLNSVFYLLHIIRTMVQKVQKIPNKSP